MIDGNIEKFGKQYTISRLSDGVNAIEIEEMLYKDIIKTLMQNNVLHIEFNATPLEYLCSWSLVGVQRND